MSAGEATAMAVRAAFAAAYAPYIRSRLAERLAESGETAVSEAQEALLREGLDDALEQGRSWLEDRLGEFLETPFAEQTRGPLEIFQEAIKFPTEVLAAAGVPIPERDAVATNALPGDLYDLAPATSRDLGEEAWTAHLAWGAAKAHAMRPPKVGVLSRNLMDRSKLESSLRAAGMKPTLISDPGDLPDDLSAILADLEHPSAKDVVEQATETGVPCAAFGPHINQEALAAAKTWGAQEAVARSATFRDPAALIRRALGGSVTPPND